MTRIPIVPESTRNPVVRVAYRATRSQMGKMVDTIGLYAHRPRLLAGYGAYEKAVAADAQVDEKLRTLVQLKAAAMLTCEFCIDLGSREAREAGITEAQLLDLYRYRESEHFDETQKLVLDLVVHMTRTPVDVPQELFDALGARFDEGELVELINLAALENLRSRFNGAFDIGSAGFSEGMVCARPERDVADALAPAG